MDRIRRGVPPTEVRITVRLFPQEADAILAALEAAIDSRLPLGPGLRYEDVESGARAIEAVADLKRRGIDHG